MGKITGFIEIQRGKQAEARPIDERVRDWREVYLPIPSADVAGAGRALHGLRRFRSAIRAARSGT